MNTKTCLIIGVSGQDGQYLAEILLNKGYIVIGVVRRTSQPRNHLNYLTDLGLKLIEGDITDFTSMYQIFKTYKPDWAFDLAAMSHVGSSFATPSSTMQITGLGVLNILEAIKDASPETRLYHASSSEQFGSMYSSVEEYDQYSVIEHFSCKDISPHTKHKECIPHQAEYTPFDGKSPYAIAKIAAHQYVKLYREMHNLFACSGILFNHESERRGEHFVTRKITKYIGKMQNTINENKLKGKRCYLYPKLKLGNLDACRDWSHAEDLVKAMVMMLEADKPDDYVIGSGETHTVREFVKLAFEEVGLNWEDWVELDPSLIRPAEVDYLCSKPTKAKEKLGWEPSHTFKDLVSRMVKHDIELAIKNDT